MSMINKEVSDFSVQAYVNGDFRTLTYPVASHGGSHAKDSGWGRC